MEKITYSIVSRGELVIKYKGKLLRITGELTFEPPVFYADMITFEKIRGIKKEEKKQIIEFIRSDSREKIGTEIIFD